MQESQIQTCKIINMKKLLSLIALAGFATLCPVSSVAQAPMNDMSYLGHHIYFKSEINGNSARFIFDTGADFLYLDSTYLANSGLKFEKVGYAMLGGVGEKRQKTRMILGETKLNLFGKQYKPDMTPIIQLKPILGDDADGIIGMAGFADKAIIIDYINEKICFTDQLTTAQTNGYLPMDIEVTSNRIYLPISVTVDNNILFTGKAMMDLGSGSTISLSAITAREHKLDNIENKTGYTMEIGGIGGKSLGYVFRAHKATIASFELNDIVMGYSTDSKGALSNREGYIGIIGNQVWERFHVIIDIKNKKLYLKPNDSLNAEFEFNTLGFTFTDRSKTLGCWVVNRIYDGSDAQKAGLKGGDKIIEINGKDVKNIGIAEQAALYKTKSPLSLKLLRNNTPIFIPRIN